MCPGLLSRQNLWNLRADILSFYVEALTYEPSTKIPGNADSIRSGSPYHLPGVVGEVLPRKHEERPTAQKRGVVVQVKSVDDDLIRDLQRRNNDSPVRGGKNLHTLRKDFPTRSKKTKRHSLIGVITFAPIMKRNRSAS